MITMMTPDLLIQMEQTKSRLVIEPTFQKEEEEKKRKEKNH
jgi:hypothetical protein